MPNSTRRRFLAELSGGAALVAASARRSPALPGAEPGAGDEEWWQLVRRQFAFRDEHVPMNAANLCPSPRVVSDAVAEWTRDIDLDCSSQNRDKFAALSEHARRELAAYLGVDADELAIVRNTTEANAMVNAGLELPAGSEVVVWDLNHPSNNVAWELRAARRGLLVKRVATPARPTGIDELIAPFARALGPKTRVLALTHVSNLTGVRLPVRELSEIAHRSGVFVHLDGAQTCGAEALDLRALGCDSFTASAHKWLVGPRETGVLYVRSERIPEIWATEVAPGWGDDVAPDLVGARRFESLGQRDDARVAALGPTLDFHAAIGRQRIEARVSELATLLKAGLREAGLTLVTPEAPELSGGVCIAELAPERRPALVDGLYREHGIAAAATGGLRLSPHVYNTREHVERAIEGVRALLAG